MAVAFAADAVITFFAVGEVFIVAAVFAAAVYSAGIIVIAVIAAADTFSGLTRFINGAGIITVAI